MEILDLSEQPKAHRKRFARLSLFCGLSWFFMFFSFLYIMYRVSPIQAELTLTEPSWRYRFILRITTVGSVFFALLSIFKKETWGWIKILAIVLCVVILLITIFLTLFRIRMDNLYG